MSTALDLPESGYPIRFDVAYPEELSRWLIFVKWLLAIPHYIILYLLQILFSVVTLIAFFAILITKTYPRELFEFAVGTRRWQNNVNAYTGLMRDEYPPFSWDPGEYAAAYEADYPAQMNRWLPLIKWLLAIPHYIVLALLGIVWVVVLFAAWFSILFTKRYPRSLFDFAVGFLRWEERVTMYVYLATDVYPPFSLKP